MALSYWIETMLTLSSPAGAKNPGSLAKQVGVEYLYPIIPPAMDTYFTTTPQEAAAARGFPIYMIIPYSIRFGYLIPGAFQLTLVVGGITAYNGTVTGYQLEQGIDYLFFHEPQKQIIVYITNLTALNQMFQMISQYLIISSEGDYVEFKSQLEKLQFPYALPEPDKFYPRG